MEYRYWRKRQLIDEIGRLNEKVKCLEDKQLAEAERYYNTLAMEQKLVDERRRLFSILDSLPALVYLVAPDKSIRFCNKYFKERFRQPGGDPCYKVIHGLDSPCVSCVSFNEGLENQTYTFNRKYHNGYTFENYHFPFTDIDGSGLVLMFGLDVTGRQKAETALKTSEEKFAKAFNNNPNPISISTLNEGRYVDVNQKWLETFDFSRDTVLGQTAAQLGVWFNPDEQARLVNMLNLGDLVRDREVRLLSRTGATRYCIVSMEKIEILGAQYVICVSKDITQKKIMEKALKLSEESFSKAFHSNPLAMTITSAADGRFLRVNEAFQQMSGFHQEQLIGYNSLDLGFWIESSVRDRINQRLDNNEPIMEMEIEFCTRCGEHRLGLYTAERIEINGEICNLSIFADITERRDMEMNIKRLERLNLVGEMAASIGHEIRNPMTSVRGFLQMFEDKYHEDREFLHLMIEELDRANSIITEFLSLAKDKRVELRPKKLTDIIKNIMPLIEASTIMQDKHVQWDLKAGPDLSLDEKEIRQLILNLVHNGLESMPAGGTITIKNNFEQGQEVLSIRDQGNGVAPEIIDKLGTPFLTTKEEGTGLGLAVCYGIAKRHHASIDIDTSPLGTCFYVKFPVVVMNDTGSNLLETVPKRPLVI